MSKTEDALAIDTSAVSLQSDMLIPEPAGLTAEVVAQYLRDCPDFFHNRKELVETLALPTQEQGAVSLVEIQLRRQRQRISELEEEITQLMSLAAGNDRTFREFMELQEQVLKADSVAELIDSIHRKAAELGLKAYIRLTETPDEAYRIPEEQLQLFATNHFNGKSAYLGRLRRADRELLFADQTVPELGSYVVLPLDRTPSQGILAFSSEDGGHFQPHMDTLFLRHLSLVVSHLVTTLKWHSDKQR